MLQAADEVFEFAPLFHAFILHAFSPVLGNMIWHGLTYFMSTVLGSVNERRACEKNRLEHFKGFDDGSTATHIFSKFASNAGTLFPTKGYLNVHLLGKSLDVPLNCPSKQEKAYHGDAIDTDDARIDLCRNS